jgi:hypothetical protein
MHNAISSVTALLFFIWILPLGIFIKPSQEKMACNGQRAICLCSHLVAKQEPKNAGKTIYKGSGSAQKEQNGSGGSSHHFLHAQKKPQINKQISLYRQQQSSMYSLLVIRSIEHVPKA